MRKLLSHPIRDDAPGWPGNPTYYVEQRSSIAGGDNANTSVLHVFNHFGTHFDAPQHYNPDGLCLNELPFDSFFYEKPLLLDIPKGRGGRIEEADLAPHAPQLAACDLLMIRTGFQPMRSEDPGLYKTDGPAVSSGAARYLRAHYTGSMKAVAVDYLSLASPADTRDGDLAHQVLLGMFEPGYICIIEDVDMADLPADKLRRVAAIPLFFTGADSGPVTVWAELAD